MNDATRMCQKICILAFIGVVICLTALGRIYGIEEKLRKEEQGGGIVWKGSGLALSFDENIVQKQGIIQDLPANLCPLFFQRIPINEADLDLLVTIPGIGPATAEAILNYRLQHGIIQSSDNLQEIKGIGPKKKQTFEKYFSF